MISIFKNLFSKPDKMIAMDVELDGMHPSRAVRYNSPFLFPANDEENAENGANVARDMNSNAATDQEQEEHKGLWGGVKEFFNFLKS